MQQHNHPNSNKNLSTIEIRNGNYMLKWCEIVSGALWALQCCLDMFNRTTRANLMRAFLVLHAIWMANAKRRKRLYSASLHRQYHSLQMIENCNKE